MKIKFKQALFTGSRSYAVNEVAEFPDAAATVILNRGFATPVKEEPKLEAADKSPVVETATKIK